MVPSEHGNGVVQAPALLTNVRPGGNASATTTAAASLGPAFLPSIGQVRAVPGVTVAGPAFEIETSALCTTDVVATAVLFAGFESRELVVAVAWFTIGFGDV